MTFFRNATKGSVTQGVGLFITLGGTVAVYFIENSKREFFLKSVPLWYFAVITSSGGILFYLGPMLFGSKSVRSVPHLGEKENRLLVLYLRSFEIDVRNALQLLVGASAGALIYLNLMKGLWWPITFLPLAIRISKEQSIEDALAPIGDFVAIGSPGEWLQPIGARRIYARKDWKRDVRTYINQARLIIIRPGKGRGIRWEINQVFKTASPENVVFYLRFTGTKRERVRSYEDFRDLVRRLKNITLPAKLDLPLYLMFDNSWEPRYIKAVSSSREAAKSLFTSADDLAAAQLRPVLSAASINLPPSPSSVIKIMTGAIVWLCALGSLIVVIMALIVAALRISISTSGLR